MTIAGLGYMYFSMLDRVIVKRENTMAQSLYLADAGIEYAKTFLMIKKQYADFPEDTYGLAPFDLGSVPLYSSPVSGTFRVSIDPDDSNLTGATDYYYITSTGTIGNIEKVVRATVRYRIAASTQIQVVSWQEFPSRTIP